MINILRSLVAAICLGAMMIPAAAASTPSQCDAFLAEWLNPADGQRLSQQELLDEMVKRPVVLLGEVHVNADHHRWQTNVLAALHSREPNLVIGLEMLPRRMQPVLDEWSRGRLDEEEFLERAQWRELWGYDAELYLPILHFARMHRLPMVALNIDRELVSKVGAEGWESLARDERMGLSDPAPASEAYRLSLGELFTYKMSAGIHGNTHEQSEDAPQLEEVMQMEAFDNFVDAQLTWDRAMAEALADAHRLDPDAVVVGIVGRGHLEYDYGIPTQLADLGIDDPAVLLPVDDNDCEYIEAGLADAVFIVENRPVQEPAPRPRLGVMIENADIGVYIMQVVDDSVAEASGLQEGDIVRRAAGFETESVDALIEVIRRQAPGTWLPLDILRDGEEIQVIAKFPQQFE